MNRRSRSWVLLWPYLALVVGAGFLHHHDAAGAVAPGPAITASDDASCPACHWLVSSAGVIDVAQVSFSETAAALPCGEPECPLAQAVPLPRTRAPPYA